MPQVTYFVGISVDGRIAAPDDDLAFLDLFDGTFKDGPYAMETVIAGFDSLVMGAATFRVVRDRIDAGLHACWPYGETPTWVVTHADRLPAVPGSSRIERHFGEVRPLVELIERRGLERVWLVGGGKLAAQFFAADLIDELILGIAPAVLGAGQALADGIFPLRRFALTDLRSDASAVALRYRRAR